MSLLLPESINVVIDNIEEKMIDITFTDDITEIIIGEKVEETNSKEDQKSSKTCQVTTEVTFTET
jgi:hypothetical protein